MMMICILGRQPAIGLTELEALYGSEAVRPVSDSAALVDAEVDFSRLGGSVKVGQVVTTLPGTNPQKALSWLQKNLPSQLDPVDGKLKLGVSLYDLSMPVAKLNANMLSLKKGFKATGQSIRVVPNTELALSSAQTHHNNLTDERGCEVLLVRDSNQTIVARATNVQDIDAYRIRDRERPKRDAFVGMLPPKLAQTIVNLAAGDKTNGVVLDPFCGTGVIPMEALLIGHDVYGTDISDKMIDYSGKNLEWLQSSPARVASPRGSRAAITGEQATGDGDDRTWGDVRLEVASATEHVWRQPIDIVAMEGYLGTPFSAEPSEEKLREVMHTCNLIMKKFLQNIAGQLEPGTRLCIAAPSWHVRGRFRHLPTLDDLERMGYNRIDFVHARREDLLYHRDDQIVGRELVVLSKE